MNKFGHTAVCSADQDGTFERWIRHDAEDKDGIFWGFENLQSVKFLLPWVTHVGDRWLWGCRRLENPSFIGLSSLETVGSRWMYACSSLKNPSFIGLSSLKYVGNDWMSWCTALENPSFIGMSSLETVGSGWMSNCVALADITFGGLSSLEKVGSYGHKKVQEYFIEQIRYYNETADHTRRYNNMLLNKYIHV